VNFRIIFDSNLYEIQFLAVPVQSKINIYEKESWSLEKSLQIDDFTEVITC